MSNNSYKAEFETLSGHLSGVPSDLEVDSEATISDVKDLIDSMLDDKDEATSKIKDDSNKKDLVAVPITTSGDTEIAREKNEAPALAIVPINMRGVGETEVPLPKWLLDHSSYKVGWKSIVRVRQGGSSRGNKDRFYVDPEYGYTFRSRPEVEVFLNTGLVRGKEPKKKKIIDSGEINIQEQKSD